MNAGFQWVSFFLAGVIILLSASGLFALVSLNILRRSKEIGVRKVLGASVLNIMRLIGNDFIVMLLIAFIVGSALGYLIINKLVYNVIYTYHASFGADAFAGTLIIILGTCFITIGFKVYRAANANPVRIIKTD
jgi:ABC-type antimicrobial peptide transport system permease subunit